MTSNLETEIYQQPAVLQRFLEEKVEGVARLAEIIRADAPRFFVIAARGTSDNAATYAKYIFAAINGIPVALAMPSLYTLYNRPPDMHGGWVIGISQSGQSPDIQAVLEEARRQNVPTLTITNDADSPLAEIADHVISLAAGEEKSVAASKTYTAELMAIATLAAYLKGEQKLVAELNRVSSYAETVLQGAPVVSEIARRFYKHDQLVVVSRGFNYCTTFEIALKIKELAYIAAQAYSSADFLHGPIALLQKGFPVLAVACEGMAHDKMLELIDELRPLDVELALITNDEALLESTGGAVRLPAGMPEWLSPIISVIPGQLLALNLAIERGYDPDNPRGLRKVTLTI